MYVYVFVFLSVFVCVCVCVCVCSPTSTHINMFVTFIHRTHPVQIVGCVAPQRDNNDEKAEGVDEADGEHHEREADGVHQVGHGDSCKTV